jgi:hypothetical protein
MKSNVNVVGKGPEAISGQQITLPGGTVVNVPYTVLLTYNEDTEEWELFDGNSNGSSNYYVPLTLDKDVTTAGIPERLVDESTIVKKAYLTAKRSNVGYVAVGDSGVDAAEATEMGKSLESEDFIVLENVDLYECWLDSVEDGEGITILATVEPSE